MWIKLCTKTCREKRTGEKCLAVTTLRNRRGVTRLHPGGHPMEKCWIFGNLLTDTNGGYYLRLPACHRKYRKGFILHRIA